MEERRINKAGRRAYDGHDTWEKGSDPTPRPRPGWPYFDRRKPHNVIADKGN
jgi:hypothetical protein